MPSYRLRATLVFLLAFVVLLASPAVASASFLADFFVKDASGTATYEAMAIHPSAIYDAETDSTYVVYQGFGLDPYIVAYEHAADRWTDAVRVGDNPLVWDSHGGPSLAITPDGYIHVFYGAHGGAVPVGSPGSVVIHARSTRPHFIGRWQHQEVLVGEADEPLDATYPQAVMSEDGALRLFFRRGGYTTPESAKEDWGFTTYLGEKSGWSEIETVFDGIPATEGFYVNFNAGPDDLIHAVATFRDWGSAPYTYAERRGLYYLQRDGEGIWRSLGGDTVVTTLTPEPVEPDDPRDPLDEPEPEPEPVFVPRPWTREDLDEYALVPGTGTHRVNQMVVRDSGNGTPLLLYLEDDVDAELPVAWMSARPEGSSWVTATITHTNDHFDAGDLHVLPGGGLEAYLTVGRESQDPSATVPVSYRGGDIERWRLDTGESQWDLVESVIASEGLHRRYNNPQVVLGGHPMARVLFSEWNSDAVNFVHKVFLFGDEHLGSRFRQRMFTAEVRRLAGANRRLTAVEISRQAFPNGTPVAFVAVDSDFPDVLCGVPLAYSMGAPILLTNRDVLSAETAEEIARLGAREIVVLGGEAAVSRAVYNALRALRVGGEVEAKLVTVRRIAGADRYATSAAIAAELRAREGVPPEVFLASGVSFPDALAVSPLAATINAPILLSKSETLPVSTQASLATTPTVPVTMVGGTAAVGEEVEIFMGATGLSVRRLGGVDRYATAALVAEEGFVHDIGLERFVVASGERFPDAVTGAVLAARVRGALLLTPATLSGLERAEGTRTLVTANARNVLDVYILGGEMAIPSEVAEWFVYGVEGVWR
ncbi:MAG: cell wall-binding repeat-containing protein [Coriobacteriia bacterium]|nr:cell wall-binding repeat-containing protein [Coriobacteriia bacterium]MBN2840850.1 cell wall-binding repeat-containing protein [Coriobacteriia bacterium]